MDGRNGCERTSIRSGEEDDSSQGEGVAEIRRPTDRGIRTDQDSLFSDLQLACIAVFEQHGIAGFNVKVEALISYVQVRNARMRQEYCREARPGNTEGVREELARKYGLPIGTVRRIIYREI